LFYGMSHSRLAARSAARAGAHRGPGGAA
jgi:hypothetical protein